MMMLFYSTFLCNFHFQNRESFKKSHLNKCFAVSKAQKHLTKDQNLLSFSFKFFNDIPLCESPGKASFDQYLEEKSRLIKATFPGKSHQLNQEEWRLETPKIQLLFLKIWPTIDFKIINKTNGEGYPSHVQHDITKVLELEMTKWEINGIHRDYMPSSANVCSRGVIYSERLGTRSRLKFHLLIDLSFLVPNALRFVPNDVLRGIVETVVKAMIEDLKHKSIEKLVEDYYEFRKEKNK